jgi:hypothetical protein
MTETGTLEKCENALFTKPTPRQPKALRSNPACYTLALGWRKTR